MLAAGLIALAAFSAGLALLVEPVLRWYYQLAWWSFIAAADGLNRRLGGRSLFLDRPRELLWLSGFSVAWWCVFELINLRLGNWYYVMTQPGEVERWAAGVAGFATVLPGILVTLEVIENAGWLRSVRTRPVRWTRGKEAACLALGALFFALPLLWPDTFFHLTWGSFVLLLEPWNRRHARRSFLRDLEAGEAAPLLRTLLAGTVCGLLWELWNYWARTKWMYTVPGFEGTKVFEMPVLGFMGFPPFALECLVVLRFAQAVAARIALRGRRTARAAAWAAALGGAAFVAVVFEASDATVDSVYVPIADLRVLPAAGRSRLDALGLHSQEKLLRALRHPGSRHEWARRGGIEPAELGAIHEQVELVTYKGLGERRALQLAALGIRRRQDLRRWTAPALAAALRGQGAHPGDRFLERRVRLWMRGL